MLIARKLGLLDGDTPDYSLTDVKEEFDKSTCPVNLDALLEHENPIRYLVDSEKISDHGLEIFIDIIFHSDMEENRKAALLNDALAYLDGKGYFSFRLHSLSGGITIYLTANISISSKTAIQKDGRFAFLGWRSTRI